MSLIAVLFVASGLLVVLSATLTAALTAVLKISESRARTLAEEGFGGADALSDLARGDVATSPLSVLRTVFLLLAVAAGLAATSVEWGVRGVWIGGPVVVLLVLLLGDMIPRGLGSRRPVRLALTTAPFLRSGSGLFGRLLFPLQVVERLLSRATREGVASDDELQVREALEIGSEEGIVGADEHRLVERAFQLDELNAWDAMTPRVDIFAWPDSRLLEDIVPELESVPYSRVPVFRDSIDDVTGILYVREAYHAYVAGRRKIPLSQLSRDPIFVPGSLSLGKLLRDFQTRRTHMGIVADEFGGTDGLVTLEDVLEELVGDIVDETDVDEQPVTRLSRNVVIASGAADLREINHRFNFALPVDENRSLNGFILEKLGHVPEAGTSIEAWGAHIEVLEASDTQVLRAKVRRLTVPDAPA